MTWTAPSDGFAPVAGPSVKPVATAGGGGQASTIADALRWSKAGALLTLFGTLLSGPVSLAIVGTTHPQPDWQGAGAFVRHYHVVQSLPFLLGFALVAGFVVLISGLSSLSGAAHRVRSEVAVSLVTAFAALVFLNYVLQTAFVPALVRGYDGNGSLLAAVTMANPDSLGWCLEMWSYAVLGIATWLIAPTFASGPFARAARLTFVANGPLSIASALATLLIPNWVLSLPGLLAFGAWNLLVVAMAVFAFAALRGQQGVR